MSIKSINEVLLVGFAGRDAEVRTTTGGSKVGDFSLATRRNWKKNEEWQNETTWHNVSVWGREAEKTSRIKKGTAVMVRGRISVENWTDNNGVERTKNKIVAYSIEMLVHDKSPGGSTNSPAYKPVSERVIAAPDDFDDDLPF